MFVAEAVGDFVSLWAGAWSLSPGVALFALQPFIFSLLTVPTAPG